MTITVQRGRRGEVSPPAAEIRDLGRPKSTRKLVFHHSRVSREARNLARHRGRFSPSPPLATRLGRITKRDTTTDWRVH